MIQFLTALEQLNKSYKANLDIRKLFSQYFTYCVNQNKDFDTCMKKGTAEIIDLIDKNRDKNIKDDIYEAYCIGLKWQF